MSIARICQAETHRRATLALALALPAAAAALPAELRFRVMREGRQIGTHRVRVTEAGDGLTALTEVDIAVRALGIVVFRFSHRLEEVWAADRLVSAVSRRDRNGAVIDMRARAEAGVLLVQGPDGAARLPAEAAPLSWWDSRRLTGPLFEGDTGKPVALRWARSALPGGEVLWRATGAEESEGRYAADGTWLGWKTKAEDGSIVTYEPA